METKELKLNDGKANKLLHLTPGAVDVLTDEARNKGISFKAYAQQILEDKAKELSKVNVKQ